MCKYIRKKHKQFYICIIIALMMMFLSKKLLTLFFDAKASMYGAHEMTISLVEGITETEAESSSSL